RSVLHAFRRRSSQSGGRLRGHFRAMVWCAGSAHLTGEPAGDRIAPAISPDPWPKSSSSLIYPQQGPACSVTGGASCTQECSAHAVLGRSKKRLPLSRWEEQHAEVAMFRVSYSSHTCPVCYLNPVVSG